MQQSKDGEGLFGRCGLFDAGHFVVLVFNGLLQGLVGDIGAQGDDGGAGLVADHGLVDFGQSFQCLLHAGLAVAAHHAFNVQGLFHKTFLLDSGFRNGFGRIFSLRLRGSGQGGSLDLVVVFGAVQVEQIQAQRVADDTEAGQAHRGGAEHGVQRQAEGDEHTGGQRDANDVVDEGPEQILVDVAQGGAAQADGGGHIGEPGVHQHHVRRINGDVRSGTDGDAGVGAGQGRGIVDAVADHGDLAGGLQLANDGVLAVGQDASNDLIHACLTADGVGGALVVAGEHHDPDAHVLQFTDGAGAVLLDGIGHGHHAQQTARAAEVERRFALACQRGGFCLQAGGHSGLCRKEGRMACVNFFAVQRCSQAVAGQGCKVGDFRGFDGVGLGVSEDGFGQRMLAPALQRGGKSQQLRLAHALGGQDVGDLGFAAGDGAGLVQRHDLGAACGFQRSGRLEQDAVLGPQTVADHDGHRCGQAQRTGAADDQHRDAAGQRIAELPAQQQPDDGGDHCDGDDRRDEEARHGVGDLGDGGLGGGGVADHPDDLRQSGIFAHAGGLAPQEARLVGGGG